MQISFPVSVEISMYPLKDDYIPSIDQFLEILHQTQGLKVNTNVMSTQVFGELDLVFNTLRDAIKKIYGDGAQYPFVIKVLNKDISDMSIKNYS